eukprot:GHVP01027851.1.p1 GENE.GHVP01027851.1~~GHVP01027851.1.p1  ORF type:complete len:890 (+),score=168.03 GHVP01027851.1:930-3599(+)
MFKQVSSGKATCQDLLKHHFEIGELKTRKALSDYFNADHFKVELNQKFQSLLSQQLLILEKRLLRKKLECNKNIAELSRDIQLQNPSSLRESVKLFIRELITIVTQLVTGNYVILRLPSSGDNFLSEFGGNLNDNLESGHELAMELFPEKELYDTNFLETVKKQTAEILLRMSEQSKQNQTTNQLDDITLSTFRGPVVKPRPTVDGRMSAGQFVRYPIANQNSQIFGFISSVPLHNEVNDSKPKNENPKNNKNDKNAEPVLPTNAETPQLPININVAFFYKQDNQANSQVNTPAVQTRQIELSKIFILIPIISLISPKNSIPPNFRCWQKSVRKDGWLSVEGVLIKQIRFEPQVANINIPSVYESRVEILGKTECVVQTLKGGASSLDGNPVESSQTSVKLEDLYVDRSVIENSHFNEVLKEGEIPKLQTDWHNMTTMQKIAGDFAETKTLNQFSLTHLGRWLKFHISKLEPDRRFSNDVLLQLMRSVPQVIDKADWEPLVADLLQANVRGGLLPLSKLASCATASAMSRIFKAALRETRRQIECGDLTSGLRFLSENARFMDELEEALDEFCRAQARKCASAMRDAIFEQTKAIHFEMIQDFFDGCRQFEADFVGTNRLEKINADVNKLLSERKQHLGVADIYSRQLSGGVSENLIYDEVRIQFWAVKMMLAPPLTTKLYRHFVEQIKDNTQHLATEKRFTTSSESQIERSLQEKLLCEIREAEFEGILSRAVLPRTDNELLEYYEFDLSQDNLKIKIDANKRVEEYVNHVSEGVHKLKGHITHKGSVDFLTKLELGKNENNLPAPITQSAPSSPPKPEKAAIKTGENEASNKKPPRSVSESPNIQQEVYVQQETSRLEVADPYKTVKVAESVRGQSKQNKQKAESKN